jgi:hypothetical protein
MRTSHTGLAALLAVTWAPALAAADEAPALADEAPALAADEAPAPPAPAPALAGYDGGFFIKSDDGNFSLKIGGRGQVRYAYDYLDSGDDRTAFAAERVRVDLSGHVFAKNVKYTIQSDFGKGFVTLKDLIIDYGVSDGLWLRAGQFKRPFSRQHITSSGRQELVDRAITDRFFGAGRDVGVAFHNDYTRSPRIEWIAGVFNGTGDRSRLSGDVVVDPVDGTGRVTGGGLSTVPAHMAPAVVGRVGYNHGGIRGYSEADLEGGPLRFAVAGSVLAELDADGDDQSGIRSELDYIVKVHGLSSTGGVYVSTAQDGGTFADQSLHAVGFHLQAGYLLAERYGIAARYAHIFPEGADAQQEITVGFSIYQFKHNFKWQTDLGALSGAGLDLGDHLRLRTQLQLAF